MSWNSAKVREKVQSPGKVREFVYSGKLIVASQQNNLPVLYSYCNSVFIHNVTENLDE